MSEYGIIPYNGKLKPCKYCGCDGVIMGWSDGIGDVMCSNKRCIRNMFYPYPRSGFHYSGKFRRRKSQAIKMWNEDNTKIEWKCDNGKTYLVPNDACPVCKHCTDIFWDYTNGPYLFICDIPDTKPWEVCRGGCPKYEKEGERE